MNDCAKRAGSCSVFLLRLSRADFRRKQEDKRGLRFGSFRTWVALDAVEDEVIDLSHEENRHTCFHDIPEVVLQCEDDQPVHETARPLS